MGRAALLAGLVACGHAASPPAPPPPPHNEAPPDAAVAPPDAAAPVSEVEGAMAAKITSAYTPQIQRCFKNELKQDPNLQGKVVLRWRLDDRGRVIEAHAIGLDDAFDHCVEDAMRHWIFDPPGRDESHDFEVTLRLVAN